MTKIDKLDFIVGTHAHSDHIGGIPALAFYFVDSNTKYYYREYRKTREDTTDIDWANYKYYLAAVHSMQKKSAQMIDVTNQIIKFEFGDFHLELLNTDIDPDELNLGENQNSIVTLALFKNTKIFLAADMICKDDQKIKDYIGKIDILMSHDAPYGVSDVLLQEDCPWADGKHIGNESLRKLLDKAQPQYNFHGHLHSTNRNAEYLGKTIVHNVSLLDEFYKMVYKPLYIEIDG